jgi:hypothetical protein
VRCRLAFAALALLGLAGCGGAPASGPRQAATPSPSATTTGASSLFAVLEGGPAGPDLASSAHNRVAIVRLDGYATAKQTFRPRGVPRIGNAAPIMPLEATVADGRVYYADGQGVVRAMTPDGKVSEVTRLPLTSSQQVLSFAVSPDGSHLMASIFSWPPIHSPPPQSVIDPPFGPGDFTLDLYSAVPGQAPTRIAHQAWPQTNQQPSNVLQVVGWSSRAPLVTVDTVLGTQQANAGQRIFGRVAELGSNGRPGPILGGDDCVAWSVLPNETVLCTNATDTVGSVRTRDGKILYNLPTSSQQYLQSLSLSPDGQHVAYLGGVAGRGSAPVALPSGFVPEGWLDNSTIVGLLTSQRSSHLALVRLSDATHVDDLGFDGFYVGPVA